MGVICNLAYARSKKTENRKQTFFVSLSYDSSIVNYFMVKQRIHFLCSSKKKKQIRETSENRSNFQLISNFPITKNNENKNVGKLTKERTKYPLSVSMKKNCFLPPSYIVHIKIVKDFLPLSSSPSPPTHTSHMPSNDHDTRITTHLFV